MDWVIYSRVSTSKQENENQLADLERFAHKQGWAVRHCYVDVVSGSGKKSRVQFDALMSAASRREFDGVLFWKLDRFSREGVKRTLRYLEQLDAWGVQWRSLQEPYFDSCAIFKDVVISIMATLAEQERITISERTKAGLRRVRAKGIKLGRPVAELDMHKVRELRGDGMSLREIGSRLKVSPALLCKRLAPEK